MGFAKWLCSKLWAWLGLAAYCGLDSGLLRMFSFWRPGQRGSSYAGEALLVVMAKAQESKRRHSLQVRPPLEPILLKPHWPKQVTEFSKVKGWEILSRGGKYSLVEGVQSHLAKGIDTGRCEIFKHIGKLSNEPQEPLHLTSIINNIWQSHYTLQFSSTKENEYVPICPVEVCGLHFISMGYLLITWTSQDQEMIRRARPGFCASCNQGGSTPSKPMDSLHQSHTNYSREEKKRKHFPMNLMRLM